MFKAVSLFSFSLFMLFLLIVGISTNVKGQNKKVLFLRDKNNSPYSLNNPEAYLSARAIERRNKFKINIDSSDLPVNPNYISEISNLGNVRIIGKSKWINALIIDCSDPVTMNQIANLPFVKSYSNIALRNKNTRKPDPTIEQNIKQITAAERRMNVSSDENNYGGSYNQISIHNGQLLHHLGADGKNMMIAFFDSGFRGFNTNRFLDSARKNNQIIATKDIIENNEDVSEDDPHGFYCLSTVAANIPGEFVGSCPKAQLILLKTEDVNSEQLIEAYFWAIGAEYADSCGVDIITSSVGYTTFDDPNQNYVYADLNGNKGIATIAADNAARKGIFVITSAGNEGGSSWKYMGTPADGDSVYAVGAVDIQKNIAGFSSFGPTYDGRIKPDGLSIGLGTYLIGTSESIIAANGTSFSTPNLAGLITSLWQLFPDISNADLMQIIRQSSDRYNNPLPQYGYGIPDMAKALSIIIQKKAEFSSSVTACRPTLSWKSYDYKGMGYIVQRREVSDVNFSSIDTFYNSQPFWGLRSYTYTDFPMNKNVTYRIIQLLDTSKNKPLLFTLDSVNISIPESCKRNDLAIYPNPAKAFFKIEIASTPPIQNLNVVILNSLGQKIQILNFRKEEGYFISPNISTSEFKKGIYIIKVYNNNNELGTQKLLLR